jgi:hypothetical protein
MLFGSLIALQEAHLTNLRHILILLRLFRSIWERQNIMTGESNVIDDEEAREELEDKLDPPGSQQDN